MRRKNLKWIDIGCGNGAFTEVLIARCAPAAVTGVDPSEASSVTPAPGREQSAPSFALPTPRPYRFLTTVSTPPPWRSGYRLHSRSADGRARTGARGEARRRRCHLRVGISRRFSASALGG